MKRAMFQFAILNNQGVYQKIFPASHLNPTIPVKPLSNHGGPWAHPWALPPGRPGLLVQHLSWMDPNSYQKKG